MSKRRLAQVRRLDTSSPATISRDYARLVQAIEQELDDRDGDDEGGPEFDPHDYGAQGVGGDDTAAIQRAIREAGQEYQRTGREQTVKLQTGARYGIAISAGKSWDVPLLGSSAEVHIGVHLWSGVKVDFNGAECFPMCPSSSSSAWHYALFGTNLNMTVGDIERVKFIQPRIDFTGFPHVSVYGFIVCGVDRFALEAPEFVSNGNICGFGAKVLNSQNVRLVDVSASNIRQGFNLNYITNIKVTGTFDGLVEAVDFDNVAYRVFCDVTVTNSPAGGDGQAVDINSVQDGFFRIICENIANAAFIVAKGDAYPTFADWVTYRPSSTYSSAPVLCRRIYLEVVGKNLHHGSEFRAIQVALDRNDSFWGPNYWDGKGVNCGDITIRAHLEDTDPIVVYECSNLDLVASMKDVTTGTAATINNAAIILQQNTADATTTAESELSGRAVVKVVNSTRTGVRLIAATNFELDAEVDGYNSADDAGSGVASGVFISDLLRKDGVLTIKNIRVKNGDTTVTPVDLRITANGSGFKTWVRDMGGHRLSTSGATAISCSGEHIMGPAYVRPLTNIDTTVATGAATVDQNVYAMAGTRARVAYARIQNLGAYAGDAANYTTLSLRRIRAGIAQTIGTPVDYDAVARAAGSDVSLGATGSDTDGLLEPGDVLVLRGARNGNGSALTDLVLSITLMEYVA